MAIAIRGISTAVSSTTNPGTVNAVAGIQDGDLMLMCVGNSNVKTPTSTGWTLVDNIAGTQDIHVFAKTASSEPGSYSVPWTASGSGREVLGIIAFYSDAGGVLSVDAHASQSNASSANRVFPSVNATQASDALVCFAVLGVNSGTTPDASMVEQWDTDTFVRFYCMTQLSGLSAGATGTRTATGTAGTSLCVSVSIYEQIELGALGIIYNGTSISNLVKNFSLEGTVKKLDAGNMTTANEAIAGLSNWTAQLGGNWTPALDAIMCAEVVGRGGSATMYTFKALLGKPASRVQYVWTGAAFVSKYDVKANIDNVMEWSATIALSGVPVRT